MIWDVEQKRHALQQQLDLTKEAKERNVLGQYSTPYPLALEMVNYAKNSEADCSRFLEPAIGTGVFYSAFLSVFQNTPHKALGVEIDSHYYIPSSDFWDNNAIEIKQSDFLSEIPNNEKYSLLITNPPYSRHHHLDASYKKELQRKVMQETGIHISGLSGLYCYFILLSQKWLKQGALSMWLIPSEFMDVNFGTALKQFLLENVNLIKIHRFNPENVQFSDALVTSSIVIFKNEKPDCNSFITFSEGESLLSPAKIRKINRQSLSYKIKWSNLFCDNNIRISNECVFGDYFNVTRGLATGDNSFFILTAEKASSLDISKRFLIPVLPPPRNMKTDIVDEKTIAQSPLYLFNCPYSEEYIKQEHPKVWAYIQSGYERKVNEGYICSHRAIWYACEQRKPAVFIMPYMGRNSCDNDRPFRFILNNTNAIATNGYLMIYPKSDFERAFNDDTVKKRVWNILNSIPKSDLINNGRVYGGGLHKIEPKELLSIPIPALKNILNKPQNQSQLSLF